jgi:hypothetical protein
VKAKAVRTAQRLPMGARRLQHVERAGDVGLHKIPRPVDGTVHVAFGGKVHYRIRPVRGKDPVQCHAVADVSLFKAVEVRPRNRGHVFKAGGIGQRVKVHHLIPARDRQPHHRRPDEPCPPGDEQLHCAASQMKGELKSANGVASRSLSDRTGSLVRPQSMPRLFQCSAPSHSGA